MSTTVQAPVDVHEALKAIETVMDYLQSNGDGYTESTTAEWSKAAWDMGNIFTCVIEQQAKEFAERERINAFEADNDEAYEEDPIHRWTWEYREERRLELERAAAKSEQPVDNPHRPGPMPF